MENQVENFDPAKLMQGVKDRIKATFVSLIPDDRWEEMVEKEITAFFEEPQEMAIVEIEKKRGNQWYGDKWDQLQVKMTPFRFLVWEHCTELTTAYMKEHLTKEWFGDKRGYNYSEKAKELMAELIPLAITKFFTYAMQNSQNTIRSELQQY